jgi:hypothetical protein
MTLSKYDLETGCTRRYLCGICVAHPSRQAIVEIVIHSMRNPIRLLLIQIAGGSANKKHKQ